MKKYLVTGAIALFAGFYLTSCTRDDVGYSSLYEEKTETFEKVFHDLYGDIDPNHDWGFKSLNSIAVANSRAAAAARAAGTRGENANANEWADISNKTGFGGWNVPPALTDGQKLRVRAYFQANPNLEYRDPQIKNFFVQQVYKGGDNKNPDTSSEVVTAAGGQQYTSNNMNHLTVGQSNVHINNFNYGDATELNVLNNGANLKTGENVGYHPDKIMLMVNIDDTSCFGYHDSGSSNEAGSVNHNDRCALVSALVIDTWAEANGGIGEAVYSSEWNRSFLGFDLAIKEGDQIWSGETQTLSSDIFMNFQYVKEGNTITRIQEFEDETHANNNYKTRFINGADILLGTDNEPLKKLISNTNFFSGDLVTLDESELKENIAFNDDNEYFGKGNKDVLKLDKVKEMINAGYYPVSGSALKTWVKPKHSYDGYYSDWIVTLTQATKVGNTEEIDGPDDQHHGDEVTETSTGDEHKLLAIGRVFVEDLFKASREDLDFNDAVFDAAIWQTTTNGTINIVDGKPVFSPSKEPGVSVVTREAEIYLIAAGGTIPLFIGNGQDEVHQLFEVSNVTMVNTRGQYSEAFGSYVNGKTPVHKIYTLNTGNKGEGEITLNDIPVDVIWTTDQFSVPASLNNARIVEYEKDSDGNYVLNDDGSPVVVTNGPAKAPHIICVPGTAWPAWPTERKNIEDGYPSFKSYVGNSGVEFWNSTSNDSQFSLYEQNVVTFKKENYGDGTKELEEGLCYYTNVEKVVTEHEITLWEGNQDFGWSSMVSLPADAFTKNNAKEGDKIRFYLTSSATNYQSTKNEWDFNIFTGWEQGYKGGSIFHVYGTSADISKGYYEFTPDANDITALRLESNLGGNPSASLKIQGQKFILTKITLVQQ